MPRSMTGFARLEQQYDWGTLSCEVRTVNHRYLEPTIRMPEALRAAEPKLRDQIRKKLSRGKVEANVHLRTEAADSSNLGLNLTLAKQLAKMSEQLSAELANASPINPVEILRWPGVIQTAEVDAEVLQAATTELFNKTLDQLIANRDREGAELGQLIEQRLNAIAEHVVDVRKRVPEILAQFQEKLHAKLEALKVEVDEDRFHQEVVYVTQKSDVAEELDRLEAHLTEVRLALKQKGPIGRRLDFLMQELNREANTLSSKSMASDTTQTAVDLKVLIEQMREQIQNIE